MSPNILNGDFILTSTLFRNIRVGQIIAVDHDHYGFIVKRVAKVAQDGQLWLEGISGASVTSENMGWVSPRRVIGKVWWHIGSKRA